MITEVTKNGEFSTCYFWLPAIVTFGAASPHPPQRARWGTFPMNKNAQDLMMGAPTTVDKSQLDTVHIALLEE